jgi:hypothetical protein
MYLFDDTGILPFGEIVINQFPLWDTALQHTPLAARFNQIKDGIEKIS